MSASYDELILDYYLNLFKDIQFELSRGRNASFTTEELQDKVFLRIMTMMKFEDPLVKGPKKLEIGDIVRTTYNELRTLVFALQDKLSDMNFENEDFNAMDRFVDILLTFLTALVLYDDGSLPDVMEV